MWILVQAECEAPIRAKFELIGFTEIVPIVEGLKVEPTVCIEQKMFTRCGEGNYCPIMGD